MTMKMNNGFDWTKASKGLMLAATLVSVPMLTTQLAAAQVDYGSAEVAANMLVIAVARQDEEALGGLLGEDFRQVLPLDEIDDKLRDRFLQAWAGHHVLVPTDKNTRMLAVGESGWTLPIPIVRVADRWRFDTAAGGELMRIRRIGRNELSAMQAALAYHDAQMEYATQDFDGDGVLEFAQKFRSSPGDRDGLYWEVAEGETQSPLGPLFSGELPEDSYYGYHYRILTAQGEHAPGGAYSYVNDGQMNGGFALVAWPVDYGNSGVMSFMLNRDGILYEADLGPGGGEYAEAMEGFDPGDFWMPVLAEFIAL